MLPVFVGHIQDDLGGSAMRRDGDPARGCAGVQRLVGAQFHTQLVGVKRLRAILIADIDRDCSDAVYHALTPFGKETTTYQDRISVLKSQVSNWLHCKPILTLFTLVVPVGDDYDSTN